MLSKIYWLKHVGSLTVHPPFRGETVSNHNIHKTLATNSWKNPTHNVSNQKIDQSLATNTWKKTTKNIGNQKNDQPLATNPWKGFLKKSVQTMVLPKINSQPRCFGNKYRKLLSTSKASCTCFRCNVFSKTIQRRNVVYYTYKKNVALCKCQIYQQYIPVAVVCTIAWITKSTMGVNNTAEFSSLITQSSTPPATETKCQNYYDGKQVNKGDTCSQTEGTSNSRRITKRKAEHVMGQESGNKPFTTSTGNKKRRRQPQKETNNQHTNANREDSAHKGDLKKPSSSAASLAAPTGHSAQMDDEDPCFLHLYIYDTQNEVNNRMNHFGGWNSGTLKPEIVEGLINQHNELVKLFRTARDKYNEENVHDFKIKLFNVVGVREYQLPTSDILGAILFENGPNTRTDYDVIIQKKRSTSTKN
ncbi:hypothetical protein CTI12_AA126060 [Artemisia annua]|uniref:Helitron helicase-like domain-containing protein n=1 Tax=Artemisia annua TaxID=35608 RepID=A0A2U1PQ43_ARTAN|nr:hypothetical protein CTI12_AA126060 [Artemisia annua]